MMHGVATISGGPSEKVGLMSGDRIVTVDGEAVAALAVEEAQPAQEEVPRGDLVAYVRKKLGA